MLAVWQAADEIELFESAWTFDHFYPIFTERIDGDCMEGWITLAALAQATRRLRVGVLVTNVPNRYPAVLANMAATLDIVSGGRLELGLGAGWNEVEAKAYGIDLHATLTERFDAFDEELRGDHRACSTNEQTPTPGGTCSSPTRTATRSRSSGRTRRSASADRASAARSASVARFAQHWNFPGGSARAVRGEARRAARALRRGRARPVGDHRVGAPDRRALRDRCRRGGGRGEALCRRRSRSRHRVPADAVHDRAARRARRRARRRLGPKAAIRATGSSPRSCAPRRWGRSGSAWDRGCGTHFFPHSAVIASPVMYARVTSSLRA